MKPKKIFYCSACGQESVQWMGRCPSCNAWNSFKEVPTTKSRLLNGEPEGLFESHNALQLLSDIRPDTLERVKTPLEDLNLVLGGGFVPGSMVLLAGEPGIGKSTLALQSILGLPNQKTLYVTGEESAAQIWQRAQRIGLKPGACHVLPDVTLEALLQTLSDLRPSLTVVDSIQTLSDPRLEASPGSIVQIRECASRITRAARGLHMPVLLIGHVNKEGDVAGPKLLEHMVDVVLYFEGDRHHHFRLLRAQKNRFGSTQELGIFEMGPSGLREVRDPSRVLISATREACSGSVLCLASEGTRSFLVEVQALVSPAVYGTPQRMSSGFDIRRLNMLLAVLEKRCGMRLSQKDVFVNVTGGIRLEDPAADLAVVAALCSSWLDAPPPPRAAFSGEVGLTGEVRPVLRLEQRLSEASRMGIECIFLSAAHKEALRPGVPESVLVSSVRQLMHRTFNPAGPEPVPV
ncbi:MAG: DNA repair protein RadA [Flavobacteriales bacterium]|nr:DNA repair protein RadA [Flavobacteriales bacterium]